METKYSFLIDGVEFWEHYCPIEKDIIVTEVGWPCNWCDKTEEDK